MACTLGLALSAVAVPFASAVASADSTNGAVHVDGFGCGMIDGNGNGVVATGSAAVITPSGNHSIRCDASVTPNSGGTAMVWGFSNTGAECDSFGVLTTNWHETVSASGNATLICHAA